MLNFFGTVTLIDILSNILKKIKRMNSDVISADYLIRERLSGEKEEWNISVTKFVDFSPMAELSADENRYRPQDTRHMSGKRTAGHAAHISELRVFL